VKQLEEKRKLRRKNKLRFEKDDGEELRVLKKAGEETDGLVGGLPLHQQEWVSLWELCQSQRYGQGMTVGTLVHSEIWNNLEKLEFDGHLKTRAFRVVVAVDEVFREFALRAQERKMKRGAKGEGIEGMRGMER
jgi:hypothetical protein